MGQSFFLSLFHRPLLLRETIERGLAFSFSPKGTSVESGLVTLQPSIETIELLCECASALSSVHVGPCSEGFVIEYAPASLCWEPMKYVLTQRRTKQKA